MINLKTLNNLNEGKEVLRGDIWLVDLGYNVYNLPSGLTKCVVIQNNAGNIHSGTTIVVPIIEGAERSLPTHTAICRQDTNTVNQQYVNSGVVASEYLKVISKEDLKEKVGKVKPKTMELIEYKSKVSLGFIKKPVKPKEFATV